MASNRIVTATAPVNIAVLKYWGKRDENLILPINSSISGTIDPSDMCTTTTVMISDAFSKDRLWLNGDEEDIAKSKRINNILREIRMRVTDEKLKSKNVHIASFNNFPTASGLASSASGYACLAYALAKVFGIKESYCGEYSLIARMGSGSACRSLYGGWVKWEAGKLSSGEDSIAKEIAPASHWPLDVLILVVSADKKATSSTSGMQTSCRTSPLIQYRKNEVVPKRQKVMEEAILKKDFQTFAEETMRDSNQFHAICLDTYPPIFYLNDISRKIISLITLYNAKFDQLKCAYTFDAGPNCVLYFPPEHRQEIHNLVQHYFGMELPGSVGKLSPELSELMETMEGALQRVIVTRVGQGPQVRYSVGIEGLSVEGGDSLLDETTGMPSSEN